MVEIRFASGPSERAVKMALTDGVDTGNGSPALLSQSMTRESPIAHPTRSPAQPQALENVRTTTAFGKSNATGARS